MMAEALYRCEEMQIIWGQKGQWRIEGVPKACGRERGKHQGAQEEERLLDSWSELEVIHFTFLHITQPQGGKVLSKVLNNAAAVL